MTSSRTPFTTRRIAGLVAGLVACGLVAPLVAQDGEAPAARRSDELVAFTVEVRLERFQGDTQISSLPYTLAVNSDGMVASLRTGAEVPIANSVAIPRDGDNPERSLVTYNYRNIGTDIDTRVTPGDGGRYIVYVSVEDSSVYVRGRATDDFSAPFSEQPAFRSLVASNNLQLRDGQTARLTSSVDRVSGEVTHIDVTLRRVE